MKKSQWFKKIKNFVFVFVFMVLSFMVF